MTRKDYIIIARALASTRPDPSKRVRRAQWQRTVVAIATELQLDNERFDHERFCRAACA